MMEDVVHLSSLRLFFSALEMKQFPHVSCAVMNSRTGAPMPTSTPHYGLSLWDTCRPQRVRVIEKSPLDTRGPVVCRQMKGIYPALVTGVNALEVW